MKVGMCLRAIAVGAAALVAGCDGQGLLSAPEAPAPAQSEGGVQTLNTASDLDRGVVILRVGEAQFELTPTEAKEVGNDLIRRAVQLEDGGTSGGQTAPTAIAPQ